MGQNIIRFWTYKRHPILRPHARVKRYLWKTIVTALCCILPNPEPHYVTVSSWFLLVSFWNQSHDRIVHHSTTIWIHGFPSGGQYHSTERDRMSTTKWCSTVNRFDEITKLSECYVWIGDIASVKHLWLRPRLQLNWQWCESMFHEEINEDISLNRILKSLQDIGVASGICDITGRNIVRCYLCTVECLITWLHITMFYAALRGLGQYLILNSQRTSHTSSSRTS